MGMASPARQQQMQPQQQQQPAQLGGGKGQSTAVKPNPLATQTGGMGQIGSGMSLANFANRPQVQPSIQPIQQPPQLGGGKGQPQPANPATVFPGQMPVSDLGYGNIPGYAQPYVDAIRPQMGGQLPPGYTGAVPGVLNPGDYIKPGINEYSVASQPMLQPAVQPSQMPQMNQEQMMQKYAELMRGAPAQQPVVAPAPVAAPAPLTVKKPNSIAAQTGGMGQTGSAMSIGSLAPKPFVSQPVRAEDPRQSQQRAIQQMANARRGLSGGMR
jgi:hypothetical protein